MKQLLSMVVIALALSSHVHADGHDTMSEEEAAMMQAWQDAAVVGEQHQALMKSEGTWEASMKMWMDPSAPPMEVTYTVTRKATLGGRVMEETWTGDFMGEPFVGVSRTGYDNITARYWSTWTDNMSTSLLTSYGNYDESGDSLVMNGEAPDPVNGGVVRNKSVIRHPSDNEEHFVMYEMRDGQEVKTMEAHLVRK